ncbi:MAG: hypothetical protein V4819_20665 [Verrucomicrobiota bacterium]
MNTSAMSRLALVQFLVTVIGVMTTCAMLKLHQYGPETAAHPEPWMRWNPAAVVVRSYGFLLLIVPAAWTFVCMALERRAPERWSRSWTVISGAVLLAALIGFLAWTTFHPFFWQKIPLREW